MGVDPHELNRALDALKQQLAAGEAVGRVRIRLSPGMKAAMDRNFFTALTVWGTRYAVPRHFGDNRGAWPIKFGTSSTFSNAASTNMDAMAPLHFQGLLFRVWCDDGDTALRLQKAIQGLVEGYNFEHLRGNWRDAGPDLDVRVFEERCHEFAGALGIRTRDDAAMLLELQGLADQHARRRI